MCTVIQINGKYVDTLGELEMELGGFAEIGDMPRDPECCLCPVNIDETAKKYGYEISYPPKAYGDCVMTKAA